MEGGRRKRVQSLWLAACCNNNSHQTVILPLTPKSNPYCIEEGWQARINDKFDIDSVSSEVNSLSMSVSSLITKCIDILEIDLDPDWSWKPLVKINNSADLITKKVMLYQTDNFRTLGDGYWIHKEHEAHARAMKSAPVIYDIENNNNNQSKLDELLKLALENKNKVNEITTEIKEFRKEFQSSLSVLTKIVTNINKRNTPTTFLLIDVFSVQQSKNQNKNNNTNNSQSTNLECFLKGINKVKSVFDSVHQFVTDPVETTKSSMIDKLHDQMFLYLVCENCLQPQEGHNWPKTITKPKEIVPKVLPLAKAGLIAMRGVNFGLQIGKCFGIPVPSVGDENFSQLSEFFDNLGKGSLDDYDLLQDLVGDHFGNNNNNNNNQSLSARNNNFSMNEFEKFLLSDNCDKNRDFERLLQCVVNKDGEKIYICRECEK